MSTPDANLAPLHTLPLRLMPGDDLRQALERRVAAAGVEAAFVLSGIGSLRPARVRLAGADHEMAVDGDLELLTLSGTLASRGTGSHLHMSFSDDAGRVMGGHVAYGCIVRTTAEVLLAILPGWRFTRELDAATGWQELSIRRQE